ncbi:MAG TPA: DUF2059 domain-containing protein [Rhizomicrobium sp.]|nr:DUF2059 domain-containing protein [Rhizomicrobium sp.]
MLHRTVLAFAAALFMALPAHAEDADPNKVICKHNDTIVSDADMKAARSILTVTKAADNMTAMIGTLVPNLIASLRKSQPNVSDDIANELSTEMQAELIKREDGLLNAMACVYVSHYTSEDIRQLAAFYQTPLGQRMIALSPLIMKDTTTLGRAWGQQAAEAAVQRVLAKHKKDGNKT